LSSRRKKIRRKVLLQNPKTRPRRTRPVSSPPPAIFEITHLIADSNSEKLELPYSSSLILNEKNDNEIAFPNMEELISYVYNFQIPIKKKKKRKKLKKEKGDKPMLSFIYAHKDRTEQFYYNLKSLVEQTNKNFEILVVDHSVDYEKTKALLAEFKKSLNIKLIRVEPSKCIFSHQGEYGENYNPALQQNIGVRQAEGEIIVLSSPEVVNAKDNVERILKHFEKQEESAKTFLYGWVDELSIPIFSKLCPNEFDAEKRLSVPYRPGFGACCRAERWDADEPNKAYYFLAAMRKQHFVDVGGIEEKFMAGIGCEDVEFSLRCAKNKFVHVLDESIVGIHLTHSRGYIPKGLPINQKLLAFFRKQFYMLGNPNHEWGSSECIVEER